MSRPEVMRRDVGSGSREIMDSVEHRRFFAVTWGMATAPGTDPAAPPRLVPGEEFTAVPGNGRP